MKREEIIQAIAEDKLMPFIQPEQLAQIVDFVIKNYQQPAEWREEDERRIVELKTFIAQCNGFNKENQKKAFDMIDAIRDQQRWKPSELQMEWLKDVIETVPMTCRQQVPLESLYADLQKLL